MVEAPSIALGSKIGLGLSFAAAITLTAIGRSFTWLSPGLMDAQMFAFVGDGWLRGRLPYIHVWDVKAPGIFAINAAVFAVFPKSFGALAVVEGVSIVACAVTIYRLLRHWGVNVGGACLALLVFAIIANLLRYNEHGNLTEIYVLFPAALSMYFFSKSFPALNTRWLLFAGLATGVATIFKLPGLSVFLAQCAFLVVVAVLGSQISLLQLLRAILILSLGILLAWLPFLLYFAYYGGLQEMLNGSFLYPFNYALAGQRSVIRLLSLGYENLKPIGTIFVIAMLGLSVLVAERHEFVRIVRQQKPKSTVVLMALGLFWLLFDLAAALAGGRNHPHYFLCLTPSLAVLTGAIFSC